MSIQTELLRDKMLKIADEYIKECNVLPLVYAKEGGIIYLNALLADFIPYLNDKQ